MANDKIEGVEPLASAIPGSLAELLRSAPLSTGKVEFAWKAAVGPALQRAPSIRLDSGELIVEAASQQWANEVSRSIHLILPRLQNLLGPQAVQRIRVRPAR